MKSQYFKLLRIVALSLGVCCLCHQVLAQSVAVQILDGRTGKSIGKGRIVHVAFTIAPVHTMLTLHTNQQGEIRFDAEGLKTFSLGVVGYLPCSDKGVGSVPESFAVNEILKDGSASSNDCGQLNPQISPGSLIYFVKRESLASRLKEQSNSQ